MKIFISYSTYDEEIVRELEKYIPKEMVEAWIDHKKVSGGDSLSRVIKKGIKNSDIYFIFISQNSLNSEWVDKEIKWAMKKEEKLKYEFIVPVLLDKDVLPIWTKRYKKLKDRKWIEYNSFEKMANSIKDTIVNKTIEKYNNECILKAKVVENILATIATIIFAIAFFSEPTKKEHINTILEKNIACDISNLDFQSMWAFSYATCPIDKDRKLLSIGVLNKIFIREINSNY